jgi:hypothetical protein
MASPSNHAPTPLSLPLTLALLAESIPRAGKPEGAVV